MADEIKTLNASIKGRLAASSEAIQAGLTEKPKSDATASKPAARATSSRTRKR